MFILGLSAYYHDSAAALIKDGEVVAAAQEERFTRKKADPEFPQHAVRYCLSEAGIRLSDVEHVVFYEKPYRKFGRIVGTYLGVAPRGWETFRHAMPAWLGGKLNQKEILRRELDGVEPGWKGECLFSEHHLSHAASAFYPSPFEEALVLTMDGVGEWATTSVSHGRGHELILCKELHFPHSLGLLYAAFTYYTGFKVNSGEYKVMGLAPYGEPRYAQAILDDLLDVKDDGSFQVNQDYFDYAAGFTMTNERFHEKFDGPPRRPEELLDARHMDLAASVQVATEQIVLKMTRALAHETNQKNLCLAGGVALNCVANSKVLRDGKFDQIWIQPAAGDAGGALGAALYAHHAWLGKPRRPPVAGDGMKGSYLGPAYSQADIERRLAAAGARFTTVSPEHVITETADALAEQKAVGWFQGRMEFGPRALGGRSILGDPRSPMMQKTLNLKVKYRESFRPFAPSVLREDAQTWFELDCASPYMLLVAEVKADHRRMMTPDEQALFGIDKLNVPRSSIPAVTHVDYSARVQTVSPDTNPNYHALISAFKERTGCGVVVNTSFNVRGEPIVCTPEDAFRCFMGTEIEWLAIGNCILRKEDLGADMDAPNLPVQQVHKGGHDPSLFALDVDVNAIDQVQALKGFGRGDGLTHERLRFFPIPDVTGIQDDRLAIPFLGMALREHHFTGLIRNRRLDRSIFAGAQPVVVEVLQHPPEMRFLGFHTHQEHAFSELPGRQGGVHEPATITRAQVDEGQAISSALDRLEHVLPLEQLFVRLEAVGDPEPVRGEVIARLGPDGVDVEPALDTGLLKRERRQDRVAEHGPEA